MELVRGYTILPSLIASVRLESDETRMPDSTSSSGPGRLARTSFKWSTRRARLSWLHFCWSDGATFDSEFEKKN